MLRFSSQYHTAIFAHYTIAVVTVFRERLRALREQRGLRIGELARSVGVSDSAIRQMESGGTKRASFTVGLMLSRELGVNPWYLCFGDDGVVLETGVRSEEAAAKALEHVILGTAARDQRVSTLEARVAALEQRIARED